MTHRNPTRLRCPCGASWTMAQTTIDRAEAVHCPLCRAEVRTGEVDEETRRQIEAVVARAFEADADLRRLARRRGEEWLAAAARAARTRAEFFARTRGKVCGG